MPMKKRPALISVMHGNPARFSFKSTLKAPDALRDRAVIAFREISTSRGSITVLANDDSDDKPLGYASPPKYDSFSKVVTSAIRPSRHRLMHIKSRPGRYSETVKR